MVAQLCEYSKNHSTLLRVNIIGHELYLNFSKAHKIPHYMATRMANIKKTDHTQ